MSIPRPVLAFLLGLGVLGAGIGGAGIGGAGAYRAFHTLSAAPSAPVETVTAPTVAPVVDVPATPSVAAPSSLTTSLTTAPSWNGIPVTVVCPTSTTDSLQAVCPAEFGADWQAAAIAAGYNSGSQKLAKVACGLANLSKLDTVTADSLTCRDGLNTAVYGVNGSGGACTSEIATYCKGVHPTPGSNPTDLCLQGVVTDGDASTNLSSACATAVANHAYAEAAKTGGAL